MEANNKESKTVALLYIAVAVLSVMLLLMSLGFYFYAKQNLVEEKENDTEEVQTNNSNGELVKTRINYLLDVLNNSYVKSENTPVGYIYNVEMMNSDTLANEYVIYTAINYLLNNSELESYNDENYNKKISGELVDKTIKNIFGNINYNNLYFMTDNLTCPNAKYDDENNYYYVNTECDKPKTTIETYTIQSSESNKKIEVYQAISYVTTDGNGKHIFKDKELTEEVNFNQIDSINYTNFKQYKITFTKGNDELFHFNSIEEIKDGE